jgi:hypothetical protein
VAGATVDEHMEALRRQGVIVAVADIPAEEKPDLPDEGAYLWDWWLELHARRGSHGFGPCPISHVEIDAWARLCDTCPQPWEVRALGMLDNAFLRAANTADGGT